MFSSLRVRLLLSYAAVISTMLCIMSVTLALILLNNPIPARAAQIELTSILQANLRNLRAAPGELDEELRRIASIHDIRAFRINEDGTVVFDTENEYTSGEVLQDIRLREAEGNPIFEGTFRDLDNQLWLFSGIRANVLFRNSSNDSFAVVFAIERPLGQAFNLFGDNLLRPLLQAALVGSVLALLFALLISSSIVRPLRKLAGASHRIAEGQLGESVTVKGPREVRELASSFNEMSSQVEQAQRAQRDFLANVSHDLKTPLTSIQGYSQAILDGATSRPENAARVIYDEAGRMRRLVEDLLDLARIESGQTTFRREPLDLNALLPATLQHVTPLADEKSIALENNWDVMPPIIGDGDRMAQVITNLLDNAITHTPSGGTISLKAEQAGGGVQIVVSDSGKGIPEGDLERIFERFYQVEKSRTRANTGGSSSGLGLAISREIVEAHQGTIRAENNPSGGATFRVWLPLAQHTDTTLIRGSLPAR